MGGFCPQLIAGEIRISRTRVSRPPATRELLLPVSQAATISKPQGAPVSKSLPFPHHTAPHGSEPTTSGQSQPPLLLYCCTSCAGLLSPEHAAFRAQTPQTDLSDPLGRQCLARPREWLKSSGALFLPSPPLVGNMCLGCLSQGLHEGQCGKQGAKHPPKHGTSRPLIAAPCQKD